MNARNITHGILGGLAGGVVFGMMMGMMGVLPMVGKMVGSPTAEVGFLVHMAISAFLGAGHAVLFGARIRSFRSSLGLGLLYGAAWWFLGALTLMPLFLGMGLGANWSLAAASRMLPSLMGHLLYGAVLGLGYAWLRERQPDHDSKVQRSSLAPDRPRGG